MSCAHVLKAFCLGPLLSVRVRVRVRVRARVRVLVRVRARLGLGFGNNARKSRRGHIMPSGLGLGR